MIQKENFTSEWIQDVATRLHYNDRNIIEKVIRALSLLEMLARSGCPFVWKGGTALMHLLGESAHRLSIDIDVICPPGTHIEDYLASFREFGFSSFELVERQLRPEVHIPKSHSKLYYQIAYKNDAKELSYILLDVLYEEINYQHVQWVDLITPFLLQDEVYVRVQVPSLADLLGDKLTAFAPNTTGIPYYKNGHSRTMEIAKQLYDIGRLFERVHDVAAVEYTFQHIARVELSYRSLPLDVSQVYQDIRQTSLCLATRGKEGMGDFEALLDGVVRVRSFMYAQHYVIENAIVDAARAAYLATLIEKGRSDIDRYSGNPLDVAALVIQPTLTNKLNKLKKSVPEAYFYWAKISELLG
jgi:predicted nucleotidyltransferase component of viral defense system